MMSEDYVSFETAKLLKEKGFDSECHSYYYPCHYPDGSIEYHRDKGAQSRTKIWYNVYSLKNLPKDHYLAPTLQMAMKWLRDEKGIAIIPVLHSVLDDEKFLWDIKIIVAEHTDESLARAAVCYAIPSVQRTYTYDPISKDRIPQFWPWDIKYWKPSPEDRIKELVKAGALLAAEIDRLNARKEEKQ